MSAKMMKRLPCAVLAVSALLGLSACSEVPQVSVYEQGQYRGKSDTRPWEGGEFKGDRAAWEKALKERSRGQNEYNRIQ
ncbi:hypothetical protein [Thauera sp.]|jgi:hypothetical protein|uniref:hypothetical protein n=1 Tax=Thauera sp. TaxID=1905334 RepID=UPI002624A523|nr:hypothetical protein [Thauera sp.]MCK6408524.1 hypothetical protein [Thauera sp.]